MTNCVYNGLILRGFFALSSLLLMVGYGQASITIPYKGPTETHLNYNYTAIQEGEETLLGVKLVVILPDNSEITLDPSDTPYGPTTLVGKLRHDTLEREAIYKYEMRVVYKLPNDTTEYERTPSTEKISIALNDRPGGTLLFDETIDGISLGLDPIQIEGIIVPDGITLDINGSTVTGASITVEGALILPPDCDTSGISIALKAPHDFQEINKARLIFYSGASGSRIQSGQDLIITHLAGNLSISNVANLEIRSFPSPGNLILENISPWNVENMPGPNQALFLDGASTLTIKKTELWLPKDYPYDAFYFYPAGDGVYLFEDCIFHPKISFTIEGKKPNNITFRRSIFRRALSVIGGAPVFEECEFGSGVSLINRTGAKFVKNAFWGTLFFTNNADNSGMAWNAGSGDDPTIDENSFYGQTALFYSDKCSFVPDLPSPVSIGSGNYFGDSSGFISLADPCSSTNSPPARFLTKRGALVTDTSSMGRVFDITGSAPSPTLAQKDNAILPKFWVINKIYGQHIISHDTSVTPQHLLQGKETLLTLEIGTNDSRGVSGLVLNAKIDGTVVKSTQIPSIRRDVAGFVNAGGGPVSASSVISMGIATVNFILPPVMESSAKIEVRLDASGITGYDTDSDGVDDPGPTYQQVLFNQTLNFEPLYARKMNILFHTVQLLKGAYAEESNTERFALTRTRDALLSFLPAMLPIRSDDLNLIPFAEQQIGIGANADTTTGLLRSVARIVELLRKVYERENGLTIDFQVVVLPKGSLWTNSGANLADQRQILFIDESKLTAFLHEMGHGFGLYHKEQYDLFPPDGLHMENVTAFINDPKANIPWMSRGRRVQHIMGKNNPHYIYQDWLDIMSKGDEPVWPVLSTEASFYSAMRTMLGINITTLSQPSKPLSFSKAAADEQTTRILFNSNTIRTGQDGSDLYVLDAPTIRAMAIPSDMIGSLPAKATGPGDAYRLDGFDAAGESTFSTIFYVTKTNPVVIDTPLDTDFWYATFDLPAFTQRYTITRIADEHKVFTAQSEGTLSCRIKDPAAGKTMGDRLQLDWEVSRTTPVEGNQPIQNMVFLSADNGNSWDPVSFFNEAEFASISTESLAPGTGIIARVIASDGVGFCIADLKELMLKNRSPIVNIVTPHENDGASSGFAWSFSAGAIDVEDGVIDTGYWSSSLDGELGFGKFLDDVILSPGDHTLTYQVSDSAGATAFAQTTVMVGDTAVDLFWNKDALNITPPGTDPVYRPRLTVLQPDAVHSARLRLRNGGLPIVCDVELYLLEPEGLERLIFSKNEMRMDSFTEDILPLSFTPEGDGKFQFRAVIKNTSPTDIHMENNEQIWTFFSRATEIAVANPPGDKVYPADSTMEIVWSFSGYTGDTVKIDLLKQDVFLQTIAETVPIGSNGLGKYAWAIPRDFPPGTDYRIRITSISENSVFGTCDRNVSTTIPDPTLTDIMNALRLSVGIPVPVDSLKNVQDADGDGKIGIKDVVYALYKIMITENE